MVVLVFINFASSLASKIQFKYEVFINLASLFIRLFWLGAIH